MRESTQKNPLLDREFLKSSQNMKTSKPAVGEKIQSLIKEESNEEKDSSSNSNSNGEAIIDLKQKKLPKNELFTEKLKEILSGKN